MEDNNKDLNELMRQNYKIIKRNGKFWFILVLVMIPDLFFSAANLHVIKQKSKSAIRCEIKSLENTSWSFKEIQKISQANDVAYKECFIYNYDYKKISNMSFRNAKKIVEKMYGNRTRKMCKKFVAAETHKFATNFPKEFATYCQTLKYEIFYDIIALIPNALSCFFLVPFADIYGRKRLLAIGCHLAYLSIFIKIILLDFTRDWSGDILLNLAYPLLKYTTLAIIFEISGDKIRLLAFVLTYTGLYLPLVIFEFLPPIYWKYTKLMSYTFTLFLPLLNWFMPEPAVWLKSKNRTKAAEVAATTLNHCDKHNSAVYLLQNKKTTFNDVKQHYSELKQINTRLIISLGLISVAVGFLFFYPYSKHKIIYNYSGDKPYLHLNGIFAMILSCVFTLLIGSKFSLAIFLCFNGILHSVLIYLNQQMLYQTFTMISISFIEVTAVSANIIYQLYLQDIFPSSHRCTCVGIYNGITNLAILILCAIRLANIMAGEIAALVTCLLGSLGAMLFLKQTRFNHPLILNFNKDKIVGS